MPYDLSYEYDAVGNRTRKVDNLSAGVTTYSYDAANQLQTSQDLSGTTTYTYDGGGNLKVIQAPASQTTTYTWDAWNRRTKVELPSGGGTVTSVYNSDGLRVLKEEPGGVVRKYLWDLQNYLVEYDGAGNVAVEYINKPERYGKLIAQKRAGEASPDYFHFDALGSTIALTDSSQTVTENYQYDAWGNRLSSNSYAPALQYVGGLGYYYDSSVEQYYIRARWYSSREARFPSCDFLPDVPIANHYCYARNRVFYVVDPSGLFTIRAGGQYTPRNDPGVAEGDRPGATSGYNNPTYRRNKVFQEWFFTWRRTDGNNIVQRVTDNGLFSVRTADGAVASATWQERYLEAWSKRPVDFETQDVHNAGPGGPKGPAARLEKALNQTFRTRGRTRLVLDNRRATRGETEVCEWVFKLDATFEVLSGTYDTWVGWTEATFFTSANSATLSIIHPGIPGSIVDTSTFSMLYPRTTAIRVPGFPPDTVTQAIRTSREVWDIRWKTGDLSPTHAYTTSGYR